MAAGMERLAGRRPRANSEGSEQIAVSHMDLDGIKAGLGCVLGGMRQLATIALQSAVVSWRGYGET